eukprot:Pompholyxophrys_punicea_v1_NODE_1468_length_701_cov_26.351393.p2 type:complete len:112 gc:universal NODE_1468_length_701_cov_26.351393:544-209(-)
MTANTQLCKLRDGMQCVGVLRMHTIFHHMYSFSHVEEVRAVIRSIHNFQVEFNVFSKGVQVVESFFSKRPRKVRMMCKQKQQVGKVIFRAHPCLLLSRLSSTGSLLSQLLN